MSILYLLTVNLRCNPIPVKGKLCTIGRSLENQDVIHLLNLSQADSDEWR